MVVGFVRFHKRRDYAATSYEIATVSARRRTGVARRLVEAVVEEARRLGARTLKLSCPAELSANDFYTAAGFARVSSRSRPGKLRPLIEWQMPTRSLETRTVTCRTEPANCRSHPGDGSQPSRLPARSRSSAADWKKHRSGVASGRSEWRRHESGVKSAAGRWRREIC